MFRYLCILAVAVAVFGDDKLSLKDIGETCKKPFVTENYDPSWEKSQEVNENSTLYIPLASKADFFRLTQQLYKVNEFDDIKESHLVNSCIRFKKDATGHVLTMLAYNEKTFVKYLSPIISEPKTFYFPSPAPLSYGGRVFISLSDNKSFTILVVCHDDGLGSFFVFSPHMTLPEETLNIAKEHVKALGFKEDNFIQPNYDLDCESPLEDVPVAKNLTLPIFLTNVLVVPPRYPITNHIFNIKK